MNSLLTLTLTLAGLAGGVVGLLFFGGLWWTLRKALVSPRPALWVASSLIVRMGAAAGCFIMIGADDWGRMLSCLVGFWAGRWLVVRVTATDPDASTTLPQEVCHAPRP